MKKNLSIILSILMFGSALSTMCSSVNATESTCSHSYSNSVVTQSASCTKEGILTSVCTLCENVKTESIPMLSHKFSTNKVTKKATCTKSGMRTYYCSDCNNTQTKTIKATGHKTKTINIKSATYVTKGYTGDKYCTKCKKTLKKGKNTKKLTLKKPSTTIKGKTNAITVKYKKVKDAKGFQVKYTSNGKSVTKTFKTTKTVTKRISNLSAGKYKVTVRAFVTQKGKKAYSNWTKKKTVTVKKAVTKSSNSNNNSSNSSNNSNGGQYWVSSGSVYHSTRDCPSLSRSSNIMSGSAPSGRRPCKICH